MLRHFLASLLLLMTVLPMAAAAESKQPSQASRSKASYIFLEACNQKQQGNFDAYMDLVRYAHSLDPTNEAVSYYLGYGTMIMSDVSRKEFAGAVALMRPYVDHHPDDYYETLVYSDANMALGQVQESLRVVKTYADNHPGDPEVLMRLGDGYARIDDYGKAIAAFDSVELTQGKNLITTARKINAYEMLRDTMGAVREMRSLLSTAPLNASYNIAMGSLFQKFEMNDSALSYLDRAERLEPENGNTYLAKAQFYNAIGDSANYDQQTCKALVSQELDVESKVEVLTDYIKHLLRDGDTTQRVHNLFGVLIGQHPHEPSIRSLYSDYLVLQKDYAGAAEQLTYELDINPTDTASWKRLMVVNIMGEDYPAAIKAANRAIELNPGNIDLYKYIAPAYYGMKQWDLAIDTYDKALLMCDTSDFELRSDMLGGKGDVYFSMGDTVKAFETYEQALRINPNNSGILNNYAYFLAECGRDLDKAERMSAKAVQANVDNVSFLDTYAWVFFKKRNYVMALFYIESAISKSVDDPDADLIAHYGDILWMHGEQAKAVEQWQRALELAPDDALLKRKVDEKQYFEK